MSQGSSPECINDLILTCSQFYPSRQKVTLRGDKKLLSDETKLKDVGITNGGEVSVKDLGQQISWRTVFLVEYVCSCCNILLARYNTGSISQGRTSLHPSDHI